MRDLGDDVTDRPFDVGPTDRTSGLGDHDDGRRPCTIGCRRVVEREKAAARDEEPVVAGVEESLTDRPRAGVDDHPRPVDDRPLEEPRREIGPPRLARRGAGRAVEPGRPSRRQQIDVATDVVDQLIELARSSIAAEPVDDSGTIADIGVEREMEVAREVDEHGRSVSGANASEAANVVTPTPPFAEWTSTSMGLLGGSRAGTPDGTGREVGGGDGIGGRCEHLFASADPAP